ncbi:hypothetical protein ACRAWG_07395 [Methylobacterium sp. P31]
MKPYLAEAALPDSVQILPPPPAHNAPLDMADRAAFNGTRALKGSARWEPRRQRRVGGRRRGTGELRLRARHPD